jgi:hypothetical protein
MFGRVYQLDIGLSGGGTRTFDGFESPALNIQFMVQQTPNAHRSYAEITIYGVNRETRRALYEDGSTVSLTAGYREDFGQIFAGSIENIELGRDGPDTFVRLYCQSGLQAFRDSVVFRTFAAGTSMTKIIRDVAGTFGLPVELIGDFTDLPKAIKGYTFSRDTRSALRELGASFNFSWAILNERVLIIRDGARSTAQPYEYSPTTGLIGSPEINAEFGVDITVLLNPAIRPQDRYTVKSQTAALTFNGVYYQPQEFPETVGESINRVLSLTHEGDLYGDTWQTKIKGQSDNG